MRAPRLCGWLAFIIVWLPGIRSIVYAQNPQAEAVGVVEHVTGPGYDCFIPRYGYRYQRNQLVWSCDCESPRVARLGGNEGKIVQLPAGHSIQKNDVEDFIYKLSNNRLRLLFEPSSRQNNASFEILRDGVASGSNEIRFRMDSSLFGSRATFGAIDLTANRNGERPVVSLSYKKPVIMLAQQLGVNDVNEASSGFGANVPVSVLAATEDVTLVGFEGDFGVYLLQTPTTAPITLRILGISWSIQNGQLVTAIKGLDGIPTNFVFTIDPTNSSVRLEGGDLQTVNVSPSEVLGGQLYEKRIAMLSDSRSTDGIRLYFGDQVERLTQRIVTASAASSITAWTQASGIPVSDEARAIIETYFTDSYTDIQRFRKAGDKLEDFQRLIDHLMSDYLYDLRDRRALPLKKVARLNRGDARLVLVGLSDGVNPISVEEVRKYSLADYLEKFFSGKSFADVGNIDLKSVPEHGQIFIDSPTPSGFTNRNFLLSVGDHKVKVLIGPGRGCEWPVHVNRNDSLLRTCP
jgi:hypothetical protein